MMQEIPNINWLVDHRRRPAAHRRGQRLVFAGRVRQTVAGADGRDARDDAEGPRPRHHHRPHPVAGDELRALPRRDVRHEHGPGFGLGRAIGALNWLGFVLATHLPLWAYENRPLKLISIGTGSNLVSMVLMGALFGFWH